jgi:hypothetical protein
MKKFFHDRAADRLLHSSALVLCFEAFKLEAPKIGLVGLLAQASSVGQECNISMHK